MTWGTKIWQHIEISLRPDLEWRTFRGGRGTGITRIVPFNFVLSECCFYPYFCHKSATLSLHVWKKRVTTWFEFDVYQDPYASASGEVAVQTPAVTTPVGFLSGGVGGFENNNNNNNNKVVVSNIFFTPTCWNDPIWINFINLTSIFFQMGWSLQLVTTFKSNNKTTKQRTANAFTKRWNEVWWCCRSSKEYKTTDVGLALRCAGCDHDLPTPKLTVCPWKMLVGRRFEQWTKTLVG